MARIRVFANLLEASIVGPYVKCLHGCFSAKKITWMSDIGNAIESQRSIENAASVAESRWLTINEAAHFLREKKISPVHLTQVCLDRIQRLNPKLNAFITVTADSALAQAHEAEAEIQEGRWRGPLHGIPIAIKDLFDTAGVRTTSASGLQRDRVPTEDSE